MKFHPTRLAGACAALALSVTLVGCSSGDGSAAAPPTVSPTLPAGWESFSSDRLNITFGAPDGWIVVDPDDKALQDATEKLGLWDNEAFQSVLAQAAANQDYFFVMDTSSTGHGDPPFGTNINVYCFDSPGTNSIKQLEAVLRSAMDQLSAENLQTKIATIGGRDAVWMTYELPSSAVRLYGTQFHWIAEEDRACSLTLTTDRPDDYAGLLEQVAGTVQFS